VPQADTKNRRIVDKVGYKEAHFKKLMFPFKVYNSYDKSGKHSKEFKPTCCM